MIYNWKVLLVLLALASQAGSTREDGYGYGNGNGNGNARGSGRCPLLTSRARDPGPNDQACGVALLKGRRWHQEDRVVCLPAILLPGGTDQHENSVAMFGVFDGHNGAEASVFTANNLPDCFIYHASSLLFEYSNKMEVFESSFRGFKQFAIRERQDKPSFSTEEAKLSEIEDGQQFAKTFIEWSTSQKNSLDGLSRIDSLLKQLGEKLPYAYLENVNNLHKDHLTFRQRSALDASWPIFMNPEKKEDVYLNGVFDADKHSVPQEGKREGKEMSRFPRTPSGLSGILYRMILKEALRKAISDIDLAFLNESRKSGRAAGSTAVVVLKADNHLLVANVGDSKSLICSVCLTSFDSFKDEVILNGQNEYSNVGRSETMTKGEAGEHAIAKNLCVKELTNDHHPDRLEERVRIEAAGGFVTQWGGVPRVNGQLAVTRAIGDAVFKEYGVTSEPEFTEWEIINGGDIYLVLASDGIFESMNTRDVCEVLRPAWEKETNGDNPSEEKLSLQDLALMLVDISYKRGSTDNIAAVVYRLDNLNELVPTPLNACGVKYSEGCRELETDITSESARATFNADNIAEPHALNLASGVLLEGSEIFDCYELVDRVSTEVVLPLQESLKHGSLNVNMKPSNMTKHFQNALVLVQDLAISSFSDFTAKESPILGYNGPLAIYRKHHICLQEQIENPQRDVCLVPGHFAHYLHIIESVPMDEQPWIYSFVQNAIDDDSLTSHPYIGVHQRYVLERNVARGGFGEIWYGLLKNCSMEGRNSSAGDVLKLRQPFNGNASSDDANISSNCNGSTSWKSAQSAGCNQDGIFILKRIMVEKGGSYYLSGMREKYFGELFKNAKIMSMKKNLRRQQENRHKEAKGMETIEDAGLKHIARFVECFEASNHGELWLVFQHEGHSLSNLLYTEQRTGDNLGSEDAHIHLMEPSSWWKWLKTTDTGQQEMRSLLYQLILAVKACHDHNITHRDIKPENMIVRGKGKCLFAREDGNLHEVLPCNLSLRLIDFGSAIDSYTIANLYGSSGPSQKEQTFEYTPPEALLQTEWFKHDLNLATMYDMWSIGVVMLELMIGTPHTFQISLRTQALLNQYLEGWSQVTLETACILRAFMEMCILIPGESLHHQHLSGRMVNSNLVSWKCTEESLMQQIKQRDPLGIGVPDIWALRLLRKLLQWYPEDRITAKEALEHPYFHPSLQG